MGFNRSTRSFEFWDASLATWVNIGGGGGGTPDFAAIALGWNDFQPSADPAWMGPPGPGPIGSPAWGQTYGWALNAGADEAIFAETVLPSNLDLTRNPRIQVVLDDGGAGTGVNFWTLEVAVSEEICGGVATTGILGAFPGMAPVNVPDTFNQTQCIVFAGAAPWYGASGPLGVEIRRRGTADTSPVRLNIVGVTLEFPVLA